MKVLKIANSARTTGKPNSPSIEKCANIYATGSGKGSGMTYNVNGISHGLHMLQSFSAKENLTKFSGFSRHLVSSIVRQLLS